MGEEGEGEDGGWVERGEQRTGGRRKEAGEGEDGGEAGRGERRMGEVGGEAGRGEQRTGEGEDGGERGRMREGERERGEGERVGGEVHNCKTKNRGWNNAQEGRKAENLHRKINP